MHDIALIRDLSIVWLSALLAGTFCLRIKQPLIPGYMLAGILIGPHGIGLIAKPDDVAVLSDLGVALLLFGLGVELSLKKISTAGRKVFIAGGLQVLITCVLFALPIIWMQQSQNFSSAILFGFICALSSTAVVTKVLMDRAESDSVHGRLIIPILLVQDLSMIPIVSLIPVMQETTAGSWQYAVISALVKALILTGLVFVCATKIFPPLLTKVARTNSREIFTLTVISICLAVAIVSKELGLSLAMGAFLAGIMISDAPYSHQALSDVMPLKDLFATAFFVTIGMGLDPAFISWHWKEVLLFVIVLIVGKALIAACCARLAAPNWRASILTGVALAQVGEFSFVLASIAKSSGAISSYMHNLFFAGAVVSLITTSSLMIVAPRLLSPLRTRGSEDRADEEEDAKSVSLSDHVILCGYGRIGRNVGLVLQSQNVPFIVIETNGSLIEDLRSKQMCALYGDAMSQALLRRAGIKSASCLILTMPDPIAITTAISLARDINPNVKIIARAHRYEDVEIFRACGAKAVVQPEFEASVEISRLALMSMTKPKDEVEKALAEIHAKRYMLFRPDIAEPELSTAFQQQNEDLAAWFKVSRGPAVGKSLRELDVRRKIGANILAIRRNDITIPHPPSQTIVDDNDELYVEGSPDHLRQIEMQYELARFCPTSQDTSDEISIIQNESPTFSA